MSLVNDGSSGLVMPVGPMYGNNAGGFGCGGDWGWIILLLLLAGNGWGNGFGGGFGNSGGEFPWLLNGQQGINNNTNNGFRDAMLNDGITSIRDGINGLSNQLANGFAGVEQGAASRQMANMQSIFGVQSALQNCCCENRANIADLKYTVATENCADRAAVSDGIRDVIANQTANTQRILDQLCQDKIDAKNDEIANLRQQIAMKDLAASQTAQNAFIQQGFSNEVDQLYNRLSNCPVPTTPVYGRTPIFTCNNGSGCGCSGNGMF